MQILECTYPSNVVFYRSTRTNSPSSRLSDVEHQRNHQEVHKTAEYVRVDLLTSIHTSPEVPVFVYVMLNLEKPANFVNISMP